MKIKITNKLFSLILLMLINTTLSANCINYFPAAIQSNVTNGSIIFDCNSQVRNNINNIIPTKSLTNPNNSCAKTCNTSMCVASGIPAPSMLQPNFLSSSNANNLNVSQKKTATLTQNDPTDYTTINVSGTLYFSSFPSNITYKIKNLTVKAGGIVYFTPGDYWVENLTINDDATILVNGNGTVRFYGKKDITIGDSINFNNNTKDPSRFLIYAYQDLTIGHNSTVYAVIYANAHASIGNDTNLYGALSASNITLDDGAIVTYDSAAVAIIDAGLNLCQSIYNQFKIQHASTASYCVPQNITITTYNSLGQINTSYNKNITVTTTSNQGSWSLLSGHGAFSDPTPNDGSATYTFSPLDDGSVTLQLNYTDGPSSITINAKETSNNNIKDDGTQGTINFAPYTFLLTSNPINQSLPNPIPSSFNTTQTAGINTNLYITAFGQLQPGVCGVVTDFAGSHTVNFYSQYINPASGTLRVAINGNNIGTSLGSATPLNLNFTAGATNVSMLYSDVGAIQVLLNSIYNSQTISGATQSFVVKPAQFIISVPNNPNNPVDANSPVFKKAGDPFTVNITVADANNNATPNFGNETPIQTINLYANALISPANGTPGTILNGNAFSKISPGNFSATNIAYTEVGIIQLAAEVYNKSYLGAGNVTSITNYNIGRFTPHHFLATTNSPILNTACTSGQFTYMEQNFTYNTKPIITIDAQSAQNTLTTNYNGAYWKLSAASIAPTYLTSNPQTLNTTAALSDIAITQTTPGSGVITLGDGGGFNFARVLNTDTAPFTAEIQLDTAITDLDGITTSITPVTFGGTTAGQGITFTHTKQFYQGRIALSNAYGSELMDLNVPITTQYFNGSDYVTNPYDSCTVLNNNNYIILNPSPANLITQASVNGFTAGTGQLILSAPQNGITGNVTITADLSSNAANLPHLQYWWPSYGGAYGNPEAIATFGIYQGNSKIIYIEEIY